MSYKHFWQYTFVTAEQGIAKLGDWVKKKREKSTSGQKRQNKKKF